MSSYKNYRRPFIVYHIKILKKKLQYKNCGPKIIPLYLYNNCKRNRALILMVLNSNIATFSATNTKKHVAMMEESQKKLAIELQCIAKDSCAL